MTEEIAIIEVDVKMVTKAKRYNKKRMSIYEKVEGFSYSIKIYHTAEENPDPELKKRYIEWKERMSRNKVE